MLIKSVLTAAALMLAAQNAAGARPLRVVATVSNMGMLAREIGGERVNVTVLASPGRDAHYLEARPSMMAALRRADLLVAVGAELEVGWLPAAIRGANNPDIQYGRPGYFEGAAHIELIETGGAADRSRGDVHPSGNPHFYLDPVLMAEAGKALAARLADMDPGSSEYYLGRAADFSRRVEERMSGWQEKASSSPGALPYHGDANYLLRRLGVPLYGHIEALPGIPPTASHLRDLVSRLRGREGVVFHMDYQPSRGAEFLGRELGWPVHMLPAQAPVDAAAEDYFSIIDGWVSALSGRK